MQFSLNLLRSSKHSLPAFNTRPAARPAPSKAKRAKLGLILLGFIALVLLLSGCTGSRLRGSSDGWSPAASSDGVVYVGTKQGEVKALEDEGSGRLQLIWSYCVEWQSAAREVCENGLGGSFDSPTVGADLVYVGGLDGFLYGIDKQTGTVQDRGWRRPVGQGPELQSLISGPALDQVRNLVVVGSEDGNLYAFDSRPKTFEGGTSEPLRWVFTTGDKIWSTPVIRDGVVYFGSHDKKVYAVDLASGEELWQFTTGGVVAGRPLLFSGLVIVGSFDKVLYALDARDGSLRWQVQGFNWFWAGAVADEKTIFAPSMDGNIYAIDANGTLLWKHDMGSPIVSRPVLVPRGLAVAGKNGKVSLLNTGQAAIGLKREISALNLPDLEVKAPLFADGEAVFVGAQDSTIRRIDLLAFTGVKWCFDTESNSSCD
jgi:outer membrane protein assembly factor BamB